MNQNCRIDPAVSLCSYKLDSEVLPNVVNDVVRVASELAHNFGREESLGEKAELNFLG